MVSNRIKLIVAHDGGRGIGKGGVIPWKIPGEQKRVAEITKSTAKPEAINAMIMGRSTYLSLPPKYRPLRDRLNVVVTSGFPPDHGIETAATIDAALEISLNHPRVESVFFFGGQRIYDEAIARRLADVLLVSSVDDTYECDTFFPPIPSDYSLSFEEFAFYGDYKVRQQEYIRTSK